MNKYKIIFLIFIFISIVYSADNYKYETFKTILKNVKIDNINVSKGTLNNIDSIKKNIDAYEIKNYKEYINAFNNNAEKINTEYFIKNSIICFQINILGGNTIENTNYKIKNDTLNLICKIKIFHGKNKIRLAIPYIITMKLKKENR